MDQQHPSILFSLWLKLCYTITVPVINSHNIEKNPRNNYNIKNAYWSMTVYLNLDIWSYENCWAIIKYLAIFRLSVCHPVTLLGRVNNVMLRLMPPKMRSYPFFHDGQCPYWGDWFDTRTICNSLPVWYSSFFRSSFVNMSSVGSRIAQLIILF